MRKLVSTLMAVTLMLVSATACAERITPSKNYVTKKVNVGTSSSVDVIYTQSSGGQDVEIYAPDNLVDYIDVRVEGGVLKVGFKSPRNNFSINGKHKKEVRVSAPAVNSLKASSSGDIIIKNGLKTSGKVTVKASSSGDVTGSTISCGDVSVKNLNAADVSADASSSGDVILAGICENASYRASSSGDVKAKGMKAVNVTASASSSGDVECYVTGSLTAKASSSGEVAYKGNPKDIDFSPKRGLRKME